MNRPALLQEEHKLSITVRLEPGCLGPDGNDHIEAFCRLAHEALGNTDADLVHWSFVPRYNKSLPEMQFHITGKHLPESMARRYLESFGRPFDGFEEQLNDRLAELIEEYWGR